MPIMPQPTNIGAPERLPENASPAQAARYLGVSQRYVYLLIDRGELPAYRLGAKILRVRRGDVEALLQPVAVVS
jgi:excisionase family DNA binding protein